VGRVLTAARVRVAAGHEAEYLGLLEVLAQRLAARGQHLWVFRAREEPGIFLEFTEGRDEATHRTRGPADADEADLEARLARLASYDESRTARWDEVPLSPR
jgi:hypothetical protein